MLDYVEDFSISRETVKWGIDIPFDKDQKSYVWVDALSNYITAIGYPDDDSYKKWWPANVHLMAQDILKFHTIYWPAMLLALCLELPKLEYIHGFFSIDGQKMSKSLKNVIDPDDLVEYYGAEAARYLIMSQFSFGHESDIQVERFVEKYNADLANGLGNLVGRTTNLIQKNELEIDIHQDVNESFKKEFDKKIGNYEFDQAIQIIWSKLREYDEKITSHKPWKMENKKDIQGVLAPIAQGIYDAAVLLYPFMPATSKRIQQILTARKITKPEPLFKRK